MNKCLNCGEEIEVKPGKKKRLYCDDKCRLRHWQRNRTRPSEKDNSPIQPAIDPLEEQRKEIRQQIAFMKAELPPPERQTALGRKSWQQEQDVKIQELESKLKNI